MFNVYDLTLIQRGSVPETEVPTEIEIEWLRALINSPGTPTGMREAAEARLALLSKKETLYAWTAWKDGDAIKIAGLNEDGFRIPAQTYTNTSEWKLLPENAHPAAPGYTEELCKLLSIQEKK